MFKPSLMRSALAAALLFTASAAVGQNTQSPSAAPAPGGAGGGAPSAPQPSSPSPSSDPGGSISPNGTSGGAPGGSISPNGTSGGGGGSGLAPRNPPDLPLRIVTWNVHPTTVGGETPEARMARLITFARGQGVAIIALQEVPRSLFTDPARLNQLSNDVTGAGYQLLAVQTEYPTNIPGGRTPTADRQNSYVVIYDPNVVTPSTQPADPNNALVFADPNAFTQGALQQARPPARMRFNVHHPNNNPDSVLNLLTWHNEAGTFARAHVDQLQDYIQRLEQRRQNEGEDWAVVGDFNVDDTTQEMQAIDRAQNVLTHHDGIDHVVTHAPLNNIINDDPALNIDPQFRSTGRHLALFAEILLSVPRP